MLLRRARRHDRCPKGGARRRRRKRAQPAVHRRALPSRHRQRRQPHRLRRRRGAQALAPRPRAPRRRPRLAGGGFRTPDRAGLRLEAEPRALFLQLTFVVAPVLILWIVLLLLPRLALLLVPGGRARPGPVSARP